MRYPILLLLAANLLMPARAERLPVEDFSHEIAFYGMSLSPDGKTVVYGETIKGDSRLFFADLASGKKLGVELEGRDAAWSQGSNFFWANNDRLVFSAHGRLAAVDRNGKNSKYALPGYEVIYLYRDKDGNMLTNAYDIAVATGMRRGYYRPNRPFLVRVNSRFGTWSREVENPGNIVGWRVNPEGHATVGIEIKGTHFRTLFRETAESAWLILPGMDWSDPETLPIGFSGDGRTLYVTRVMPNGLWGLYPLDLGTRKLGEPLLANAQYDILPGHGTANGNGILLQRPIFSAADRNLLGVRYLTDFPRIFWVNPSVAEMQALVDHALPQKINTVVSLSDDLQRAMILSWTANDPGTYYFFDRAAGKLEKFVAAMPWIDPAKMSEVAPVRFKARDGLMISGYLTFPKGRPRAHLPMVVLIDEDLGGRNSWSFNSTAQFLANRGYAVLQVNHRGSTGFGESFRNAGRKQFSQHVQFDLADGAKWAVREKLADPARIAIVGFRPFGGCSALLGLALEPSVYCCGIASAPVTDLVKEIDADYVTPDNYAELVEWIGDPKTEGEKLRAMSPVNLADKIKSPVLIIHSREDDDWSYNHSKHMVEALKKAGREVEFQTKYTDLHYGYERHAKWLAQIEDFLARKMPADLSPAAEKR